MVICSDMNGNARGAVLLFVFFPLIIIFCLCAYIVLVFDVYSIRFCILLILNFNFSIYVLYLYVIYLPFRADDDLDIEYLSLLLIFSIFVSNLSQSEAN